jgi:ribosomal protein S18 acetylase RimI-like enzyme
MNAAVAIRRATADDRGFVRELGRSTARSSVSEHRTAPIDDVLLSFERLLDFAYARRHELLIAEIDGTRAGFILTLYDLPDEVTGTAQAFVAYTAVAEALRGRGIARALLDAAEISARALGLPHVSLMVTEENAHARALYDRAGYVTERRMMTKTL